MSARLNYRALAPKAHRGFVDTSIALGESSLGKVLIDLVYLRVSQLNGCAYCVNLHGNDLLRAGESFARVNSVSAWHEAPFYSERERAALAWAESVTLIRETRAADTEFDALKALFSEQEIAELTYAVALMNAFNRMAVGMRMPVPMEG
ncbi:carboxymuconolactone decarboxylase family protein [Jeongeupia naejangsanensis]|uniref:Carboxymuconolactone decarboxylase family protein n=1 Tax=Jeongeupia naejangsanensis TaxID=613195 RepID=A0ABS2BPI9_9NEIS|nr:carboxymuconolactone decarboxylase family protein [Jeongeupia naejangsanensis]MBM3116886.1 carboxymuconolactone decarboxylase family protein [Jeongeupia naejangsanensis]